MLNIMKFQVGKTIINIYWAIRLVIALAMDQREADRFEEYESTGRLSRGGAKSQRK